MEALRTLGSVLLAPSAFFAALDEPDAAPAIRFRFLTALAASTLLGLLLASGTSVAWGTWHFLDSAGRDAFLWIPIGVVLTALGETAASLVVGAVAWALLRRVHPIRFAAALQIACYAFAARLLLVVPSGEVPSFVLATSLFVLGLRAHARLGWAPALLVGVLSAATFVPALLLGAGATAWASYAYRLAL